MATALIGVASFQEVPPLPYYSEEAVAHSGSNVFIDPKTGDGIIIWDQPTEDGTKPRIPVELARHIEPGVQTEVEYSPITRQFLYDFTLTNGISARQRIKLVYFVSLQDRERYSVSAPDHWKVHFPRHPVPLNRMDQFAPIYQALTLLLPDADPSGVIGVAPGKSRGGLQIMSSERPGLIDVYAQGRAEVLAMPTEPSEKIRSELLLITYFPYNYVHTLAVAPKYDEQTTSTKLAESYKMDSQALAAFEKQFATSAFFEQTSKLLNEQETQAKEPINYSSLVNLAKTPLERSFAKGIAVGFGSEKRGPLAQTEGLPQWSRLLSR